MLTVDYKYYSETFRGQMAEADFNRLAVYASAYLDELTMGRTAGELPAETEGKAKMEEAGFRVTGTNREEFAHIIAADTVTWGKAVAATGFKAD